MTKKERIHDALNSLNIPVSYRYTDINELPRFSYSLISHWSDRYSNKRHHQRTVYQIDYLSPQALDVESDETLWKVIEALEERGLITSDWQEIEEINTEESIGFYQYWIEVR